MNSDQFMHWLEWYFDSIGESTGLLKKDVEVIRTKMASVEKPAAEARKEWPIKRVPVWSSGAGYLDGADVPNDQEREKQARMTNVYATKSDPMWPSERYEKYLRDEIMADDKRQMAENAKSDPTAVPFESVDDMVENLKRRHPIAHHQV